jgi:carboxyl-terminal processing protease
MKEGQVVIVAPIDGTPAQRAGLRPGDVILSVDGQEVAGQSLDQVVSRILGPKGTEVTLTILLPDSGETREITIVRAEITIENVVWERLPGTEVADVRIAAFSQGVTQDLEQALIEIEQQGLSGVILDLRNNPGGLLDEAIGTASQFLASGNVLLVKDAQGQTSPIAVKEGRHSLDLPMVVLINQGTASAAEIVSGALQDAGRATLVGETTFGTGTVLNQFALSDGSAVLLATQLWLTPSGRVIWRQGIEPDEVVVLPGDAVLIAPGPGAAIGREELETSTDAQLLRALELVSAGSD